MAAHWISRRRRHLVANTPMTESWSTVRARYLGLKGWWWHIIYLPPSCEYLAAYVIMGALDTDDARDIIRAVW